jgi:hypothetical protein
MAQSTVSCEIPAVGAQANALRATLRRGETAVAGDENAPHLHLLAVNGGTLQLQARAGRLLGKFGDQVVERKARIKLESPSAKVEEKRIVVEQATQSLCRGLACPRVPGIVPDQGHRVLGLQRRQTDHGVARRQRRRIPTNE